MSSSFRPRRQHGPDERRQGTPNIDSTVRIRECRREWGQQQQRFRQLLGNKGEEAAAMTLFLKQHAMVHSAAMSQSGEWSFEDAVLAGLSDD